jgi:dolichol-phosphate mannosyltransferase
MTATATSTSTASSPAPRTARVGVVVPLANEEATIDELTSRILAQLLPQDKIFYVLDNVSKDGTRKRIAELHQIDPRVTEVWAPKNRCVVDAYFAGYRAAMNDGCDWILEMDGGLSHLPEEIPNFLKAMAGGADYAPGSRFAKGGSHNGPLKRYLTSRGGTLLTNLMLGTRMKDMCSGFECFSRAAMAEVLSQGVRSRAHFFQTEIRVMLQDWKWVEVPINYHNPSKGLMGSGPVKEALTNLWRLRKERNRRRGRSDAGRGAASSPVL